MLAVFIGTIVVAWHILFGFIGPGLLLNHLFSQFHSKSRDVTAPITRIIGYGSILMVIELLALQIAVSTFRLPAHPIVIAKFLLDFFLTASIVFSTRQGEIKLWCVKFWRSTSAFDIALVAIALIYGICGTAFFPYGHDNSATSWTAQFILNAQHSIASSEGAPSYIGVLVFPSLLLQGVAPVPTLVAGLKIPLALLVAFVIRRFMNQLPLGSYRGAAAIIAMFSLYCVFFSHYGLHRTGKETVFSITLFFLFIAELIHRGTKDSTGNNLQAALALAASIGFGAVTVPYALMLFFTLIGLEWVGGRHRSFRPFRFISTLILVTSLPIVVSVHAMLEKPWWLVVTLVSVPFLACYSLKNVAIPLLPIPSRIKRQLPVYFFLFIIGILFWLMPVHYFLGYFPMDGKSTIIQVIDSNGTVGWIGAIGLVLFFFSSHSRTNFASVASAMFPFVGLMLPLILARYPDLDVGVAKLKVWDLAKDIGNWVLGFHSSIFTSCIAIMSARYLAMRRLKHRSPMADHEPKLTSPITAQRFLLVAICLFAIYGSSKTIKRLDFPTYNTIGGHHDPIFADFVELCYKKRFDNYQKVNFDRVWISGESAFIHHQHNVRMYGIKSEKGNFKELDRSSLINMKTRVIVLTQDEWHKFAKEKPAQANQFQVILENEKDVIILRDDDAMVL